MDFYQRYSTFGFHFIYLRSNLPIERLSLEDIEILRNNLLSGRSDVTEELLELVSRTFRSIIIIWYDWNHNFQTVGFGGGATTVPNNALVFIVRDGRSGDWMERVKYLQQEFIPMMEEALSEKLDIPVVIFDRQIM